MYFVRCLKYSCFLLQPTRTEILWMLHVTSLCTHWKREYTALSDTPDSELLFTLPNWSIKIFSSVESLPVKCFFSDSQVPQVFCGMSVTVVIITIIITHTQKAKMCTSVNCRVHNTAFVRWDYLRVVCFSKSLKPVGLFWIAPWKLPVLKLLHWFMKWQQNIKLQIGSKYGWQLILLLNEPKRAKAPKFS